MKKSMKVQLFDLEFYTHVENVKISDMLFSDILEDMKEECQKYGSVVSLLIPKENPGKGQVTHKTSEVTAGGRDSM